MLFFPPPCARHVILELVSALAHVHWVLRLVCLDDGETLSILSNYDNDEGRLVDLRACIL